MEILLAITIIILWVCLMVEIPKILTPCPYCDLNSTCDDIYYTWTSSDIRYASIGHKEHALVQCDYCSQIIHFIFEINSVKGSNGTEHKDLKLVEQFPRVIPKIDEHIPILVSQDYEEGIKCFNISAFKASTTMFRRALQNSLLNKGASPNKRLFEQIKELRDKNVVTEDIADWATEIRLAGNLGAHPPKDGLEKVTKEEVEELMKFMTSYFQYVYVMPALLEERRKKKQT